MALRERTKAQDETTLATLFTWRAIVLALLLAAVGCWWVVENSLVRVAVQVGGSVPPVPALAALVLLVALYPLLRRWGMRRGELLFIYLFVAVAVGLPDVNCLGYFFPYVAVPQYFQTPENNFAEVAKHLPGWYALADPEAARQFFEGAETGQVAWGAWMPLLLGWGAFLFALWVVIYASLALFRRRWIEHERLTFPIVEFVVHLTGERSATPSFFRDGLMWLGFGVGAIYNLFNILKAFSPVVPALGRFFDLGALFTERPWNVLSPFWISIRPEIFGIGYLMSTDMLFTVSLSYLALRFSNVVRVALGYQVISGFYDYQEIATGAYLGMMVALVWLGRRHLLGALRGWREFRPQETSARSSSEEVLAPGMALLLIVLSWGYMLWWTVHAGMSWWLAGLHLLLIVSFAIVYARMRAETGAPLVYLFPFWQQQKALLNVFGSKLLGGDGGASLTLLASLGFLCRGTYPQMTANQIEGMSIAARARIKPSHLTACVLGGAVFGLVATGYLYLVNSYQFGFNILEGGRVEGGMRSFIAQQNYREAVTWQTQPSGPNLSLVLQTALGFGLTLGMVALRPIFLRFPFHPLGFAMGSSYGFHLWAPFLMVWILKLAVLRMGGARLYRRLVPLFLGLVLGHYAVAGILWGALTLYNPELAERYVVHFG